MRYGIFGGTFDPVHIGHIRAAVEAKEHLRLDAVLFVPAAIPPHKRMKRISASPADRLAMLKLAVRPWPFMKVLDYEIRKGGVGYTVDTVNHIRGRYGPGNRFFLLIGSDWVRSVRHWKSFDEIRKKAGIAVFPRTRLSSTLPGAKGFLFIGCPVLPVSSTDIRRKPPDSRSVDPLPAGVRNYIIRKGLYGAG